MTRSYPPTSARRRAVLLRAAAVAVLAAGLGGCYTARQAAVPATTVSAPYDYRLRHPIEVHEGDQVVELFIGSSRGGLTPRQRAEVLAFAQRWKHEATGGIVVEVPSGTGNERAAADSLREVEAIFAGAGVPPQGVYAQPYHPEDPLKLATIRLKYPRMVAGTGPCGLWPEDLGPSLADPSYMQNRPYWNFGCANQRNLAAMVAEPADLVQPRGETPSYTARRTTVLDKYRKGESTATNNPNENKGKISDVGQ
jgi:pilus assembly protein CpaD